MVTIKKKKKILNDFKPNSSDFIPFLLKTNPKRTKIWMGSYIYSVF